MSNRFHSHAEYFTFFNSASFSKPFFRSRSLHYSPVSVSVQFAMRNFYIKNTPHSSSRELARILKRWITNSFYKILPMRATGIPTIDRPNAYKRNEWKCGKRTVARRICVPLAVVMIRMCDDCRNRTHSTALTFCESTFVRFSRWWRLSSPGGHAFINNMVHYCADK